MMKHLRISLAAVLSLVLVLTGNAMAQARAMTAPSGEMVICTGSGPVMILVDAEGQPTGEKHFCPDGAFGLLTGLTVSFQMQEQPVSGSARLGLGGDSSAQGERLLAALARGPPVFV